MASPYDNLSLEDLEKLHQEVRDALRKKRGQPTKESLLAFLSPEGPDFMGTGLTFTEYVLADEVSHIKASYRRASRDERARRRDAAVDLGIELGVILQQTRQATLYAREAIASVIVGDWKETKICRDILTFEGDHVGEQAVHQPIFAKFVKMLDDVLAGIPKEEPVEPPPVAPLS